METVKERLIQYANDCISDKIISCQAHKNACKRFLRDVERAKDPDCPFYWNEQEAENIIVWFTMFKHTKGDLTHQPIHLMPAQQFHICQLYGWRRKKDQRRKFKKLYLQEARKNAKSQEQSILALHEIAVTSTQYGELLECYTAGPKRQQSRVVMEEAINVLNLADPRVRSKFKITSSEIRHIKSGSFIRALSKEDQKTGDGTSIHMLCLDERHQMPTNEFAALFYGAASSDPLLISITTAGVDLSYPCYREYEYVKKILDPNSDIDDDEYLVDIFELEPEDYTDVRNVTDEKLWIKANPVRATYDRGIEKIRSEYREALEKPEDLPMALTKLFDIWFQAKQNGYMDMEKWKACQVDELPVDITGMQCVIGADMSAKIDLTSLSFIFKFADENQLDIDGEPVIKYIIMQHSFIPNREKLLERINTDKVPYDAWEMQGFLSVTDSPIVDQKYVMNWAFDFIKKYKLDVACWAIDPHNAIWFMSELSDRGETVYDVSQNYTSLNDATVGFREEVYSGNVIYTPDPLLNFAMGNATVRMSSGLMKIDKDRTIQRIDPVDATICAFKLSRTVDANAARQKRIEQSIDAWLAADW